MQTLKEIGIKEAKRIANLEIDEFVKEYNEWFNLDEQNALTEDDDKLDTELDLLKSDLWNDFMQSTKIIIN